VQRIRGLWLVLHFPDIPDDLVLLDDSANVPRMREAEEKVEVAGVRAA
jgi:hypothetical protein